MISFRFWYGVGIFRTDVGLVAVFTAKVALNDRLAGFCYWEFKFWMFVFTIWAFGTEADHVVYGKGEGRETS